jgi:hypothetical protein
LTGTLTALTSLCTVTWSSDEGASAPNAGRRHQRRPILAPSPMHINLATFTLSSQRPDAVTVVIAWGDGLTETAGPVSARPVPHLRRRATTVTITVTDEDGGTVNVARSFHPFAIIVTDTSGKPRILVLTGPENPAASRRPAWRWRALVVLCSVILGLGSQRRDCNCRRISWHPAALCFILSAASPGDLCRRRRRQALAPLCCIYHRHLVELVYGLTCSPISTVTGPTALSRKAVGGMSPLCVLFVLAAPPWSLFNCAGQAGSGRRARPAAFVVSILVGYWYGRAENGQPVA